MRKKNLLKVLMLIGILPLNVLAEDVLTSGEEQVIELENTDNGGNDENVLQVPVTATVSNTVLNVKFTGPVSLATVSVSNTLTGVTVRQQSLPAVSGTICNVPVTGLSMGNYTVSVTNENSGASVSGDFDVEEEE